MSLRQIQALFLLPHAVSKSRPKDDGSVVAWGYTPMASAMSLKPNTGFVAIAAGYQHSLGLKATALRRPGNITTDGRCDVLNQIPGFVANCPQGDTIVSVSKTTARSSLGGGPPGQSGWPHYNQCDVPEPNTGFLCYCCSECIVLA